MSEIVNAKITGTHLGLEDHGIFTSFVYLEWGGYHIGFGGYSLDNEHGIAYLDKILETVGVDKWEDLKGQYVRLETEGLGGKAVAIGHIVEDKWFNQQEFFDDKEKK